MRGLCSTSETPDNACGKEEDHEPGGPQGGGEWLQREGGRIESVVLVPHQQLQPVHPWNGLEDCAPTCTRRSALMVKSPARRSHGADGEVARQRVTVCYFLEKTLCTAGTKAGSRVKNTKIYEFYHFPKEQEECGI